MKELKEWFKTRFVEEIFFFFTVGRLDGFFTKHAVFDSSTCTPAVLVGLRETIRC